MVRQMVILSSKWVVTKDELERVLCEIIKKTKEISSIYAVRLTL